MPLWRPGPGPVKWPLCWTWNSPPCSAGGDSSPVLGTDWIAVKAATASFLTVLATRSASESCSPATSPSSQRCHRGRLRLQQRSAPAVDPPCRQWKRPSRRLPRSDSGQPRWKGGWKSWVSCDRSPGRGCPVSMSWPVNVIHSDGVEPPAVGISRRWSGSIHLHHKLASRRLRW